jgi:hypothetical protein
LAYEVGARALVSERSAFKCLWCGMALLMVIHVDDMLFTPSPPELKEEFLRLFCANLNIRHYFGCFMAV